jgi:hypothetical protein
MRCSDRWKAKGKPRPVQPSQQIDASRSSGILNAFRSASRVGPCHTSAAMSDQLTRKATALREVVSQLVSDLGPDRIVVIDEPANDAESVTVALRSDPSRAVLISIVGMEQGRFTVSYDKLHTKRNGDASIEPNSLSGVVYEGLHWIIRKVFDHGFVAEEFGALPAKRRIRG